MNEAPNAANPPRQPAVRRFGHYELRELLGRSQRTMAWLAHDPRAKQDLVIVMPRVQPGNPDIAHQWEQAARKSARLNHPNLAHVVEVGVQDHWPYVTYDPEGARPLPARLDAQGMPPRDAAELVVKVGHGLAYAHESGAVHGDLQPFHIFVTDSGQARLVGLEVALDASGASLDDDTPTIAGGLGAPTETERLQVQRRAAQRDVLTLGLILHQALTGQPALDDPDTGRVVIRLPPAGRDIVRLAWSTPRPIPDPLRAIANRATDRQERQRYRGARTLISALEGWLRADAASDSGPLALLADRMHAVGVLPGSPGGPERAARLALMDRERTSELAEVVMQDLALSFEMLRAVNTAQVRGSQVSGAGPVLTVRRAIAMLGLDGVRRAALGLRPWPGPLDLRGARELERLIARVRRAGRVAQALRPAGYDAEVVNLVTLLQNLGLLVMHYHFADEARQIDRLMQAAPPTEPGGKEEPGMTEQAAAFAVLGVDIDAIGAAVARHWGLDDSVLHMIRRLPVATSVHTPETDDDMLRLVASCANETVEAVEQPVAKIQPALARVAQRYARTLEISARDLQDALHRGVSPEGADPADKPPPHAVPTLDTLA
jgi:eukaryotic-like serine/threonine-protein kinase